jgi:hypothetical protein
MGGTHAVFEIYINSAYEYPYCHAIYGGEGKPADPYPVSPLCTPPSGKNGAFTYGDAHPEWYALHEGERRREVSWGTYEGQKAVYNFCTSNADAITEFCRLVVNDLIDGKNKYVDHLHIWPLDCGTWCECEECQKANPTDWYVMMLNEIDERLAAKGLDTRIVFICYTDTTWAPLYEKLKNTKRFSFMLAAITRTYQTPVPQELPDIKIQPYANQVEFHLYMQQEPLRWYLKMRGIIMEGYSTLGTNDWRKPHEPVVLQDEVLKQVAEETGQTVGAVELRFLDQLGEGEIILLAKSVTPSRIKANIEIDGFTLTDEQMERLKKREMCYRFVNPRNNWGHDILGDGW